MHVRVEVRTRGAAWWIGAVSILARLLGPARAKRWARAGVQRLVRYRIEGGRWHALEPSTWDMIFARAEG